MQLVPARCTQCNAVLKVDASKDEAVCEFCGTPFIVEKALNYYNAEALLERAENFLQYGEFNKANEYANRVLDADPKNGKAHLICLLSEAECVDIESYAGLDYDCSQRSYDNAVKYLDSETAEKLKSAHSEVISRRDRIHREWKERERQIKEDLENARLEREKVLEDARLEREKKLQIERERKEKIKKAFRIISVILMVLGIAVFMSGCVRGRLFIDLLGILIVAFAADMISATYGK